MRSREVKSGYFVEKTEGFWQMVFGSALGNHSSFGVHCQAR